jgi:hypothetical protein
MRLARGIHTSNAAAHHASILTSTDAAIQRGELGARMIPDELQAQDHSLQPGVRLLPPVSEIIAAAYFPLVLP